MNKADKREQSLQYANAYIALKANMLAYLRKRLDKPDIAEDIIHDAFVKAITHNQLQSINNLNAWLMRVMQNAMADYYRTKDKTKSVALDFAEAKSDELAQINGNINNPEVLEVHNLFAQFLLPFINTLPAIYADVIVMKDYQGLTIKAIALALGVSQPAVKSRISRGRKMLQNALLECCAIELESGFVSEFTPKGCIQ